MISVRGEQSESRVTAPEAPPLTVILAGPRLERREDGPRPAVARQARAWRRESVRAGAVGYSREAARRAPKVLRRSGRTTAAGSRGRIAPAHQPNLAPASGFLPGRAHARRGRASGARRAPRAFKAVGEVVAGRAKSE